jgi:hypothetical protein
MKKNDLQVIMRNAWMFFHTTGQAFGECLRLAWANFKLVRRMHAEIVHFHFRKVDGSIREAWGTLRADLLPPVGDDKRRRNEFTQVYFDTEKQEFRAFKKLNIMSP